MAKTCCLCYMPCMYDHNVYDFVGELLFLIVYFNITILHVLMCLHYYYYLDCFTYILLYSCVVASLSLSHLMLSFSALSDLDVIGLNLLLA